MPYAVLRQGASKRGRSLLLFCYAAFTPIQAWREHKYFCRAPYQMGLYARGQSLTVTPVFLPKSTGNLETLSRDHLARILSCPTHHVEIVISPMSTLFEPDHRIVCAYNAGAGGLIQTTPGIPFSMAPGDLCNHAVHMTRSLKNSFGSQINGGVLFFYLTPAKDFLSQPDFDATQTAIRAWDEAEGDCSPEMFKKLADVFAKELTQVPVQKDKIDYLDAVVFPALDSKPFITKHPFRYHPPEGPGDPPCHVIEGSRTLGDTYLGRLCVRPTPSRPNPLVVFIRDNFLNDGSPLNKSIQVATKGEARHSWAGNVVILKNRGHSEVGMNATADDVKAAIEYFKAYGAQ